MSVKLSDTVYAAAAPCRELRRSMLYVNYWTVLDKMKSLPTITYEQLTEFSTAFYATMFVETLVQGNITLDVRAAS